LARSWWLRRARPDNWIKKEVDPVLAQLGVPAAKMNSVLGRHLARGLEAK